MRLKQLYWTIIDWVWKRLILKACLQY